MTRQTQQQPIRALAVALDAWQPVDTDTLCAQAFDGLDLSVNSSSDITAETIRRKISPSVPILSLTLDPIPPDVVSEAPSRRNAALESVAGFVETADRLGASYICVSPPIAAYADALNGALYCMQELGDGAECAGISLLLRAPCNDCLLSPVETRCLLESLARANVGLCLEMSALTGEGRLEDWLQTNAPFIRAYRGPAASHHKLPQALREANILAITKTV